MYFKSWKLKSKTLLYAYNVEKDPEIYKMSYQMNKIIWKSGILTLMLMSRALSSRVLQEEQFCIRRNCNASVWSRKLQCFWCLGNVKTPTFSKSVGGFNLMLQNITIASHLFLSCHCMTETHELTTVFLFLESIGGYPSAFFIRTIKKTLNTMRFSREGNPRYVADGQINIL